MLPMNETNGLTPTQVLEAHGLLMGRFHGGASIPISEILTMLAIMHGLVLQLAGKDQMVNPTWARADASAAIDKLAEK